MAIDSGKFILPSLVGIFLLLVFIIIKAQDNSQVQNTQLEVAQLLEDVYSEQNRTFKEFVNTQYRHLAFLLGTPPIQGINRAQINNGVDALDGTTTDIWATRLSIIFTSLASNYENILQMRLIDSSTGMELVRVNKVGQDIKRVISAKLQNKSHTEYFINTVKLPEHTLYISELDLNRENGTIEYPVQPTIRFAIPVYNELNQLYSLLIINVSATELINNLQAISNSKNIEFSLLDQDDHIIEHVNEAFRFTKDLAPNITWHNEFKAMPWANNLVKITKQDNSISHTIGLVKELTIAPIEIGGANKFTFINLMNETTYQEMLLNKRLSSLGYLAIIFMIFIIISLVLFFYVRSAAQLRKTRTQFAAIIQGASDGIISINHKLQIESFNVAAAQFFPELNHFKSKKELSDLSSFSADFIEKLLDNERINNKHFQITSSNKSADLRVKMSPILDDKNIKIGNALFIQDISEQIRYEREIKEINASLEDQILARTSELEQERKNAVNASNIKSKFVSTISHEMRTPLNGLLGSLNLMAKEKHDEHINSLLAMMNSSASSLSTLINDVLDLSKIEAGKLEIVVDECNVIGVIEDSVISLSAQATNKNIDLDCDVSEIKHFSMELDAGRLIQILNNLIGNALKFTLRGGVYVSARTRLVADKVRLEVDIQDSGIGIAKELQSRLFQSFTQADSSIASEFGGTGLGLSISKQLCELMHGQISVVSEKDKGSTFSFYIDTVANKAKVLPDTNVLGNTSFKLLLCNEFIDNKWKNSIQLFGGSLDEQQPDYYIVDCHHADYQSIKDNKELLAKSIVLSRHSDRYADIEFLFAFLNRPTKLLSFLRLFSSNTELLEFFTSKSKEENNSQSDFPDLADKTYLVVDDNDINVTIACHLLHLVHAKTITATSGVEAIKKLIQANKNNIHIDAILLDCQMPIMDGYEATERIRKGEAGERFIITPIIALTANAMSDERTKCLALGMNDYLTKPIDNHRLFSTLNKFLIKTIPPEGESKDNKPHTLDSLNQAEALNRLTGDEELYAKLLEMFVNDTPSKILSLKSALTSGDYIRLRKTAHGLKGTSGNISALQLCALASELEHMAVPEQLTKCTDLVRAIELAYQQVEQVISVKLNGSE